ncbi:MAG: hypothetical protein KDD03_11880 [Gelidibacter sp.]|nr:hypothetical protein [Gelidibacter sp.]
MNKLIDDLKEYYGENSKTLEELYERLAKDWGFNETRNVKDAFRKCLPDYNNKRKNGKQDRSQYRKYWLWASILNKYYGVPFKAFQGDRPISILKASATSDIKVLRLKNLDDDEQDREAKEKLYKSSLINFIRKAERNLLVYDYLERQFFENDQRNFAQSYRLMHKEIYDEIKNQIKAPDIAKDFEYIRLMALPIRGKFSKIKNPTKDDLKKSIIKLCSTELFEHICEMTSLFEKSKKKVRFLMLADPTRAYEYGIVDDGEHLISEYYRYNRSKQSKPDLLIVEDNAGAIKDVSSLYTDEITKLRKDIPILKVQFTEPIIKSIIKEYQDRLLKKSKALNKLKKADSQNNEERDYRGFENDIKLLQRKQKESEVKLDILNKYF